MFHDSRKEVKSMAPRKGDVFTLDDARVILLRKEQGYWWVLNLNGSKIQVVYEINLGRLVGHELDVDEFVQMLDEQIEMTDEENRSAYSEFMDGYGRWA